MATELANAYVQVIPSADGMKKRLAEIMGDDAEEAGKQAGEKSGNGFVGMMKKIIAAAGIGKIVKDAIGAGADLEQSYFGGLDTLYDNAADKAREYANEAAKFGVSMNDYAEQAVSFGAALKSAYGNDTLKAAEAVNIAIQDMADNSAKMGTDIESIQTAYQGFAKQNYTMLDNLKLGYGGTKQEMERLLEDAEKLTGVEYNIDNLGDVYSAIHVIQGELKLTGVAADEASTTISGSLSAMQASWRNVMAVITTGGDISGALSGLTGAVTAFAKNIIPAVTNVLAGLPAALGTLVTQLAPELISQLMPAIANVITQLMAQIPGILSSVAGALFQAIGIMFGQAPELMYAGISMLTNLINGMLEGIPQLAANIPTIVQNIADTLSSCIGVVVEGGKKLLLGIVEAIPQILPALIGALPKVIDTVLGFFTENIPIILDGATTLLMAVVDAIPTIITELLAALPNIINSIVDFFVNNVPVIVQATIDMLMGIIQALPTIIQAIITNLPQIISAIATGLVKATVTIMEAALTMLGGILKAIPQTISAAWTAINGVGKSLIEGLWNGISNVTGWIISKIKGFGSSVLSAIKGIFGVHSPSTEMAWIGEMLDRGLAEGIEDNVKPVTDAVNEITGATAAGFSNTLAVNAALGVSTDAQATGGLNTLVSLVAALSDKLDNMQIYLDGATLVGGISDRMDSALGTAGAYKARGLA